MEENERFVIYPATYRTWVGFAHDYCHGCKYEDGSFDNEDKRIDECSTCKDDQDYYYYRKRDQPILIAKNKEGKNIANSVIVK